MTSRGDLEISDDGERALRNMAGERLRKLALKILSNAEKAADKMELALEKPMGPREAGYTFAVSIDRLRWLLETAAQIARDQEAGLEELNKVGQEYADAAAELARRNGTPTSGPASHATVEVTDDKEG